MDHSVFTIVAPVASGRVDELDRVLDEIGADPAENAVLPLRAVPGLHFASLTVHRDAPRGAQLIFELNVDGSVDDHLPGLVKAVQPGLDAVVGCCEGWPTAVSGGTGDDAVRYLREHVVAAGAFHVGNTGRTVERIHQEAALHAAIEDHLDERRAAGTLPVAPADVRDDVLAFVGSRPDLAWALAAPPPNLTDAEIAGRKRHKTELLATLIGGAIILLPLTLVGGAWFLVKECLDRPDDRPVDPDQVRRLEAREDLDGYVQNHLTSIVDIKPGPVRRHVLRLVLSALDALARVDYTHGTLGGISSIHFAHWSVIDDGRRLLFVSNFDGSWESYLDDFIELAHTGLTAVWSNGVGFPRTHFLVTDGATQGLAFKTWARRSQQATAVWYSAYPGLGVSAIDGNSAVRAGLSGSPSTKEIAAWLRQI